MSTVKEVKAIEATSIGMLEKEINKHINSISHEVFDVKYTTYIDEENEIRFSALLLIKE